jgi:hypothetical protein
LVEEEAAGAEEALDLKSWNKQAAGGKAEQARDVSSETRSLTQ